MSFPVRREPNPCGRCRAPLPDVTPERRLRFETRSYDLCPACWAALQAWMATDARVRRTEIAA
jgi:hypothetical protein